MKKESLVLLKQGDLVVQGPQWDFVSDDGISQDGYKKGDLDFPIGTVLADQKKEIDWVHVQWLNGHSDVYPHHKEYMGIVKYQRNVSFPNDRPLNKQELEALAIFHELHAKVVSEEKSWKERMLGND